MLLAGGPSKGDSSKGDGETYASNGGEGKLSTYTMWGIIPFSWCSYKLYKSCMVIWCSFGLDAPRALRNVGQTSIPPAHISLTGGQALAHAELGLIIPGDVWRGGAYLGLIADMAPVLKV